ncbi:MAG: PA14 domain-containing protein [Phycisphaeraceae bacterium]
MHRYRVPFVLIAFITACVFAHAPLLAADPGKHIDRPASQHPVVAGEAHLKQGSIEHGQLLLAELNCVACHTADDETLARLSSKQAPLLGDLSSRVTPQWLREYLTDPHATKPGSTMPNLFHASEAGSRDSAVDYLMHFLLSQGKPLEKSKTPGDLSLIQRGRDLYHSVGCVACHSPQEAAAVFNPQAVAEPDPFGVGGVEDEKKAAANVKHPSVPLGKLGNKTTVEALAAFLMDPLKTRPSARMPSIDLSPEEAKAIAAYLLREQLTGGEESQVAGLRFEYYEGGVTGDEPAWDKLTLKAGGSTSDISVKHRQRGDGFALRFSGTLRIEKAGKYTFFTTSDDGSWLYIDGKKLVDNGGVKPANQKSGNIELTAGNHAIMVGYTEVAGQEELSVAWQGPDIKKGPIPADVLSHSGKSMQPLAGEDFKIDQQKAAFGSRMFSLLRCASCHQLEAGKRLPVMSRSKPLDAISVESAEGCLSDNIRKGYPKYNLSEQQNNAIRAALAAREQLARKVDDDKAKITRTLTALNCYACHERDAIGGPEAGRAAYFRINGQAELGDEGRLPPKLTSVGGKLRPETITDLLTTNNSRVRPYMATRMPLFGKANAGHLVALLDKVDSLKHNVIEPQLSGPIADVGRKLTGVKGFGCINCHDLAGLPSLGVPAVDLANVYSRVKYEWFMRFLDNPIAYNKNTRMPTFWPEGKSPFKDVYGGDVNKQQSAIWNYLSLGRSMPRPEGMDPKDAFELAPISEPVVFRTFMNDMSPRAIAVGYPENVHVAFDANVVRMGKAWRGKFFDAKGTWEGRAGGFAGPAGVDTIDLPAGPAFATPSDAKDSWPKAAKTDRNLGGRFKGYKLDEKQQPIFMYELEGIRIEEQAAPQLSKGGTGIVRRFSLSGDKSTTLLFRAAAGSDIVEKGAGVYVVDSKLTLTLALPTGMKASIRKNDGKSMDLLIEVSVAGEVKFEVGMDW